MVAEEYFSRILSNSTSILVLEGYSYLSVYASQRIAEVIGIVKYLCEKEEIEIIVIAPTAVKKALTGKGNATKKQMIAAARALGCNVKTEHEADALGLLIAYALSDSSSSQGTTTEPENVIG